MAAEADRTIATSAKHKLRQHGIDAGYATDDKKAGLRIWEKVAGHIDGAKVIIPIITQQTTPYVYQEIGYAVRAHKAIIPLAEKGLKIGGFIPDDVERIEFDPHNPNPALCALARRVAELKKEMSIENWLQTHKLEIAIEALLAFGVAYGTLKFMPQLASEFILDLAIIIWTLLRIRRITRIPWG